MNAFDVVVTVALGSVLASILLSKDVSLAQGVLALALLLVLQFIITWLSVRVGWVRRLVTGNPTLLLYQGQFLPDALRRTRITHETDGSFSVVKTGNGTAESSLTGVDLSGVPGQTKRLKSPT